MRVVRRMLLTWVLLTAGSSAGADGEPWAWLGVGVQPVSEELSWQLAARFGPLEGNGVYIVEVLPHGPARAAGLQAADVIVEVAGKRIWDVKGLQGLVRSLPIGVVVEVTVLRGQGRVALHPRIASMPEELVQGLAGERYGLILRAFGATEGGGGSRLTVTAVEAASPAEAAGVQRGDAVIRVEGQEVSELSAYAEILSRVGGSHPVHILLERGEQRVEVVVQPPPLDPRRGRAIIP